MAGQNIYDTHFQADEHQISPASVGRLAPRWTLTTAGAVSATPTVANGVVYVPDYGGKLWAVSAGGGKVLWSNDISTYTGVAADVSRTSPAAYRDELILGDGWILSPGTSGARVFAVDPQRGLLYAATGNNYSVPPGVCTTPQQTGCAPPAADDYGDSILALNLTDGTVAWADHTLNSDTWTIPQPFGPDFDFGAGPNPFTTTNPATGRPEQLLGAGQKSSVYWSHRTEQIIL